MQLIGTCLAMAAAGLIAGCATAIPDTLPPEHVPGARAGTGIVVGSVTSPGDARFGPGHYYQRSYYDYRSLADPRIAGSVGSADWGLSRYARMDDPRHWSRDGLAELNGRLFAVELPEGQYEFFAARPIYADSVNTGGYEHWTVVPRGYRFTVRPGVISYLGNLDSRVCRGWVYARFCKYSSCDGVQAVAGEVLDRFERDQPLLLAKFPFLADARIERAVMPGEPWFRRRLQESGWQPPHGAAWRDCAMPPGQTP